MARDAERMGAPPEVVASLRQPAEPDDCWIWPENWVAVQVFRRLRTQWLREYDGMNGRELYYGLRYEAVEPTLRLLRIPRREWPDTFDRLDVLESAALPLLNQRT